MMEVLKYSIYAYSSFSSNYRPENVLLNNVSDQTSRWSSESNNPPQFLVVKLDEPAIVQQIVFGKFEKTHVCNLKKFKIYGGLKENGLVELLDGGLRNDPIAEEFSLRYTIGGHRFPCQFIKIVPLQSWGPSFNFSIWYVELRGILDPSEVQPCLTWFDKFREREAVRVCLKFLRSQEYIEAFESLERSSNVKLEHPFVTELYKTLMCLGDYKLLEELIIQAGSTEHFFDAYLRDLPCVPQWTLLSSSDSVIASGSCMPGMRGGHQMLFDPCSEVIYLFGGWNGTEDLADLWCHSLASKQWLCLSYNTEEEGGPSPRSCHKMVLDSKQQRIYVLGRYVESTARENENNLKNDFYVYDIQQNQWHIITDDTASMGGPGLVFDHHLALDEEHQIIYCFGGRLLTAGSLSNHFAVDVQYSGLYAYEIPSNTWRLLRSDSGDATPTNDKVRGRIGHAMLYSNASHALYILGGQRSKDLLSDVLVYHIDTDDMQLLSEKAPFTGYSHRAAIDAARNEIYVLCVSSVSSATKKDRHKTRCCVYQYNISQNCWNCLCQSEESLSACGFGNKLGSVKTTEVQNRTVEQRGNMPCPRYAHAVVYDTVNKVYYLYGGKAGECPSPFVRLDDFWSLRLVRLTWFELHRKLLLRIRETCFRERILSGDAVNALQYLQNVVSEVVQHDDALEEEHFQRLASSLFMDEEQLLTNAGTGYISTLRGELFESLMCCFPAEMKPPKAELIDLVPL